jgi:hypothetical protein
MVIVTLNFALALVARADPGVFDDRIVFGQSAAFKGAAAALGLGMRDGILAAFNEANAAGGVHGRKLELVSYNDGYEPEKVIANTKRLIGEDKVFALVGEVGTPTSKAVQRVIEAVQTQEEAEAFWARNQGTVENLRQAMPRLIGEDGRHYADIVNAAYAA